MAVFTVFPVAVTSTVERVSGSHSYAGSSESARFTVVCPTWATEDPANIITFRVDQSFDSGATWRLFGNTTFVPRTMMKNGTLQSARWTAGDPLGVRLLRAVMSSLAPITMGIDVTIPALA